MTYSAVGPSPRVRTQWPYSPRFANVNGWCMHYIDEGEGDPVVLLHGNPTWGFLYREVIGPLVKSGRRVIVPNMVGFGCPKSPHANRLTLSTAIPPI